MSLGTRRRRPPTPGFVANNLWRRAGEIPSFHISPTALGHARDLITGSVLGTYNSATPAMAVGADGLLFTPAANAPVIEYDAATRACLGARIWEVVTQQARATRDLTQSTVWTASAITPTRDQVGIDGTANSATRLTATASDGTILQTLTSASATRVSGFWVRRITGSGTVEITMNGGSSWTALTLASTFARYSIPAATITNPQIGFRIRSNGDEIAVDGVQLQSVATLGPTVFNPSTSLAASSTADVWSITGADFNRIYNQSAVTFYFDGSYVQAGTSSFPRMIAAVGSNPNTDEVGIHGRVNTGSGDGRFYGSSTVAGTNQFTLGEFTSPVMNSGKVAAAFALNDAAMFDGQALTTDNTGALPVAQELRIMGQARFQPMPNGYIRELAIFRSRRPNANLRAVTT